MLQGVSIAWMMIHFHQIQSFWTKLLTWKGAEEVHRMFNTLSHQVNLRCRFCAWRDETSHSWPDNGPLSFVVGCCGLCSSFAEMGLTGIVSSLPMTRSTKGLVRILLMIGEILFEKLSMEAATIVLQFWVTLQAEICPRKPLSLSDLLSVHEWNTIGEQSES